MTIKRLETEASLIMLIGLQLTGWLFAACKGKHEQIPKLMSHDSTSPVLLYPLHSCYGAE